MQKWSNRQKLSREAISTLEKYFVSNLTKPHYQQIEKWAKELNVDFQRVHDFFQMKWRGKLEYEYSRQKEVLDPESRQLQKFEPDVAVMEDNSFYEEEDDGVVELENAEEDL